VTDGPADDKRPPERERSRRARRLVGSLAVVIIAVSTGLVAGQAARATEDFGPLRVQLGASVDPRGDTRVSTLLGDQVLSRNLVYSITARVEEVAVEPVLDAAASERPVQRVRAQIESDRAETVVRVGPVTLDRLGALQVRFLGQLLAYAVGGALVTALAVDLLVRRDRSRRRSLAQAVAIGMGTGAVVVLGVAVLRDPGVTERTGWLAYGTDRSDVLQRLDDYDERYARTGRYLLALLQTVDGRDADDPEPAACIVAVSDIHSRNVYPLIAGTVSAFRCTVAVVDAGDFVDWGEEFEADFFATPARVPYRRLRTGVADIGVPYMVVRGNHDSDSTMAGLRAAGARELDGEVVEVAGLRIAGQGLPDGVDPGVMFTPDDRPGQSRDAHRRAQVLLGEQLAELIGRQPADVAVLHHPDAIEALLGAVPVAVSGHVHDQSTREVDGSFHLQLGSVGGAGLRSFDTADGRPRPQQWAVLKFDRSCRFLGATLLTADSLGDDSVVASEVRVDPGPPTDGRRCGPGA
jgi:predicted phosphodiesterase